MGRRTGHDSSMPYAAVKAPPRPRSPSAHASLAPGQKGGLGGGAQTASVHSTATRVGEGAAAGVPGGIGGVGGVLGGSGGPLGVATCMAALSEARALVMLGPEPAVYELNSESVRPLWATLGRERSRLRPTFAGASAWTLKGARTNASPSSGGSEAWTGADAKRTAVTTAHGTMLSQMYIQLVVSEQNLIWGHNERGSTWS